MPSPAQEYEVLFTIGSGSYGKCQKIRRKSDGKMLVWKELDYGTMGDREKQMLVSEVNLLRDLRHPNIVRYHDRIIDRSNTTLYIVMEYCEGGDLSDVIKGCIKERRYLEEQYVLRVMAQLALALKECHTRSDGGVTVLHRDLKPANVFLDAKKNVKLGDFGLARILNHDTSFAKTFVGTPYYMSPEQVNRLSYNEKSDIWSLGCLLYELCALMPPFNAYNQQDLAEKIREGKFRRIPYRYSDELNSLLSRMLNVKDYQRPSVDAILDNNLLAEVIIKEPGFLLRRNAPEEQKKVKGRRRSDEGAARPLQKPVEAAPVSTAELRMKEKLLRDRETALKDREERLERREKELCVREQMLEEKLTRAENILKNYNHKPPTKQRKALAPYFPDLSEIDVEERLSPSPGKKKVHFAGDSKENHRPDRHELNLKNTHIYIPTLDEVERTYTFKSRQLLGIR